MVEVKILALMQVVSKHQNLWRILFKGGKDVLFTSSFKDFSDAFTNSKLSELKTHIQHQHKAPSVKHSNDRKLIKIKQNTHMETDTC